LRVVLDSNVLLAAYGTRGLCEALLDVCFHSHRLVLSEHILTELRQYLNVKFKASEAHADAIIASLRKEAELVEPAEVPADAFSDPDDLPVIGTALAAQVDCLVTGDHELEALGSYRNIPILSPRIFYDRLQ
jgi:putative PIN family toxin of toxin-antitoxin system